MNNNLIWLDIEKVINDETYWLRNNIMAFQPNKNPLNYSDDIFYRLVAILIVSGLIKASEFNYRNKTDFDFINSDKQLFKKHGADWHNNMIKYLSSHFLKNNYKIDDSEPKLYYGHADLKIIKNNKSIYFEIDTVSIFKLWINLLMYKNITIIVITQNKIIKFES